MKDFEEGPDQPNKYADGEYPLRLADDAFYRALTSNHRRHVLYYLLEENESTVEELATVLSGLEASTTGTMQTQENRTKRILELEHNHLPLLADAGLIDYDAQTGSIQIESLHPRVGDIIRQSIRADQPDTS